MGRPQEVTLGRDPDCIDRSGDAVGDPWSNTPGDHGHGNAGAGRFPWTDDARAGSEDAMGA